MKDKVVLAYSGGLDTTVAIGWLAEKYGYDVIACAVDVGQGGEDMEVIRRRAFACGAVESVLVDAKDEFAKDYVLPALKANALYEGKYPLVSALSRPTIVAHMVRIARESGAVAVAHGATGKGNDQVRFEVSTMALAPDLISLAPVRDSGMTRDATIAFVEAKGLPVDVSKRSPYSIDQNVWGRTAECGVLEDPWVEPPEDVYVYTSDPLKAPDRPEEIIVGFEAGVPVSVDGKKASLVTLIDDLNHRVGAHGVGRIDMIENRLVGIKSREIYECPAAIALITAHRDLEDLTLDRDLAHQKARLEILYTELVYNGLWFSPLKRAVDAFIESSQAVVTGEVRLKLHKGRMWVVGRRSPNALYSHDLATYDAADAFHHEDARGFVNLWGLPVKTWAKVQGTGGGGK